MRNIVLMGSMLLLASFDASASMVNAKLDCFTTVRSDASQRLDCLIFVEDEKGQMIWPDKIQSMEVTLPDGTTTIVFDYNDFADSTRYYFKSVLLEDLVPGATKAPSGKYSLSVTDTENNTLSSTDYLAGNYMAQPVLKVPTQGQLVTNPEQMIEFSRTKGADHYRIMLKNANGSPVISDKNWPNYLYTKENVVNLPLGVLKDNRSYFLHIQALDTDQDRDRRANTQVISFDTQF